MIFMAAPGIILLSPRCNVNATRGDENTHGRGRSIYPFAGALTTRLISTKSQLTKALGCLREESYDKVISFFLYTSQKYNVLKIYF